MATSDTALTPDTTPEAENRQRTGGPSPSRSASAGAHPVWSFFDKSVLRPVASLKITIVLFLAAIFIVFVGTLAQVDADIWTVVNTYFRFEFSDLVSSGFPWIHPEHLFVRIPLDVFFPKAFFPDVPTFPPGFTWAAKFWPHNPPVFPDWAAFFFPRGWTIGLAMLVNLFAAHLIRFKIQARGKRLWAGIGVLIAGIIITLAVITSGSSLSGLQANPIIDYGTLWVMVQTSVFGLAACCIYAAFSAPREQSEKRLLYGILATILSLAAIAAVRSNPDQESVLRILYQVIKATLAAGTLLAGCVLLFKKRGGIVLLHAGVALLMIFDVVVGEIHVESQMTLLEGQSSNFSRDIRHPELAVIDHSPQTEDRVTVAGYSLLDHKGAKIQDKSLPFNVETLAYYFNSVLHSVNEFGPNEKAPENYATTGLGTRIVAVRVPRISGTDNEGDVNAASAYLKLTSKDGKDLGTYLVSAYNDMLRDPLPPQFVNVDGAKYEIALRFKRVYTDYSIALKDVQKNDYLGTNSPRDYSSYVEVIDPDRPAPLEYRIWMNNPMRYAGKTYYQQSFDVSTSGESTVLQVVDNIGWMTPYLACMMVALGMFYQFGHTLLRFLHRRLSSTRESLLTTDDAEESAYASETDRPLKPIAPVVASLCAVGIVLAVVAWAAIPRHNGPDEMNVAGFGDLPMWNGGRAMPIDTFARNTLMTFSDKQTFKDDEEGPRQPAIVWLMDLMTNPQAARKHRILRIENTEVLNMLQLEPRKGLTYSIEEIEHVVSYDDFMKTAIDASKRLGDQARASANESSDQSTEESEAAASKAKAPSTTYDRKLIDLAMKRQRYEALGLVFAAPAALPTLGADANRDRPDDLVKRYVDQLERAQSQIDSVYANVPVPLLVPAHLGQDIPEDVVLKTEWESLVIARIYQNLFSEFPREGPQAIGLVTSMLDAYGRGDVDTFNKQLSTYTKLLERDGEQVDVSMPHVAFEAWFNRVAPFNLAAWLDLLPLVLALLGWLIAPRMFQRAAFWSLIAILIVHTLAIGGRIYISGRPPVTNLYSSAVFIGWAIVLGGLIIESLTHLGAGNFVAALAGFLTLRIAHALSFDGDTFGVLQAVLDTQFWLATHVVCVTLGYATTYLAGLLGLVYLVLGITTPQLNQHVDKELTRMMYGTICFAAFFSFVGTVLGGLWADDSWGRFWGWDPKENGALIIVLWNALILHARWAGLAKGRGLAVLAVLGNAVVSWSWFAVNELGVGKHAYGATEGRLFAFAIFSLSQFLIAAVAFGLPRHLWRSHRRPPESLDLNA